jgi:hypothetical protein
MSQAMEIDGIEARSVEKLDLRLSLVVLTIGTVAPLYAQGTDEVLQKESEPQHV